MTLEGREAWELCEESAAGVWMEPTYMSNDDVAHGAERRSVRTVGLTAEMPDHLWKIVEEGFDEARASEKEATRVDGIADGLDEKQASMLRHSLSSRPFAGLLEFHQAGVGVGFLRKAWERQMEKLRKAGLVVPYVHGGYELTDLGKAVAENLRDRLSEPSAPRP